MNKQCPICSWNMSHKWWGRHMVKVHGWRYYDGLNPEPPTFDDMKENINE